MKRKLLFFMAIMLMFLLFANAQYSGGDGTELNPYKISSREDLEELAQKVKAGDKYLNTFFLLTTDLDLSTSDPNGDGTGWVPIGLYDVMSEKPFSGTFDGGDHIITGLRIDREMESGLGLFGYTSGATLKNIHLTAVNIRGYQYVGGLVGYGNCCITVTNCSSTGKVDGYEIVGGLIGLCYQPVITQCYSRAEVIFEFAIAGGLIGASSSGTGSISHSFAAGNVSGGIYNAGGFAGELIITSIFACYSIGNVSGESDISGFANTCVADEVTACYSSGKVTGDNYVSGFVGGLSSDTFSNCYFNDENSGQTDPGAANIVPKNNRRFASGEVCWLLQDGMLPDRQQERPVTWGQTILRDTEFPLLNIFDTAEDTIRQVHRLILDYQELNREHDTIYARHEKTIDILPLLVKPGKTGTWNTKSDGLGITYTSDTLSYSDTILYAIWKDVPPTPSTPENYLKVCLNDFYFKCYTLDPVPDCYFVKEGECFTFKFVYEDCCEVPYPFDPVVIANGDTIHADAEGNYTICDIREALDIQVISNEKPVGNENLETAVRIWAANGLLHLSLDKAENVTIYNVIGQLIYTSLLPAGDSNIPFSKGVYFVKTAGKTVKVQL